MIDDYEKTMELVEEMKVHLPIPVHAGPQLIQVMRDKGIHIKACVASDGIGHSQMVC
jgi:hypothetical protein